MPFPLELPGYVDVGYGCRIELSSTLEGWSTPLLIPAQHPGTGSFHTNFQDRPSMIVDLGTVREIKRIRVFNHDGVPDRAIPLMVSCSRDRITWHPIIAVFYDFGGQVTEAPLDIILRERLGFRYLKLEVQRSSFLQLDYVEISTLLPPLSYGRYLNVRVARDAIEADYCHHESYGFAWTFTCTFAAISLARAWGIRVNRIDFSRALAQFKDEPGHDAYPDLFEQAPALVSELPAEIPYFERHGMYVTFDLASHRRLVAAYFEPSSRVKALAASWITAYGIDLQRTIVMVYRGTDKDLEIRPAAIEDYMKVATHLRRVDPGLQIVIQTDQTEALEAVLANIPDAIYLRELPVTTGKTVIHNLPVTDRFGITRSELATRLLAMIYLYSGARYVVSHTGNIGAWLALYRGSSDGFYQFDEHADLRDPSGNVLPLDTL